MTSLVVEGEQEPPGLPGYLAPLLTAASLRTRGLESLTLPIREAANVYAISLLTDLKFLEFSEWQVPHSEPHFAALTTLTKLTVRVDFASSKRVLHCECSAPL